jgi:hypothetical protein
MDEKRCPDYIKSIYRSGRVLVIIWGAIGWNSKSLLVFLEKEKTAKRVNLQAYRDQVFQPIIYLLFDQLGTEYIFMEDGAKVYKKHAWLAKL